MIASWIQTYTGTFDPANPRAEDVRIEDIAHGLSNICRYGGQTSRFYSVAEHSVLVARAAMGLVEWQRDQSRSGGEGGYLTDAFVRQVGIVALLHDAAEAYIGDIVTPIKRRTLYTGEFLVSIDAVEAQIVIAIGERFAKQIGVQNHTHEVKGYAEECDHRIVVDETLELFPHGTHEGWANAFGKPLGVEIVGWDPVTAERKWLSLWTTLTVSS
jgi:hypothetical protein